MESLLLLFAFFIFFAGLVLLGILAVIDMKTMLLPNKYVLPFAVCGLVFHALTFFSIVAVQNTLIGGALGYGLLWCVRFVGNWHYKTDSLGLGDVKLLGAGGLWLGWQNIILALTIGAAAGLVHGVIVAFLNKKKTGVLTLKRLRIPAGPGFTFGIAVVMLWTLLPELLK